MNPRKRGATGPHWPDLPVLALVAAGLFPLICFWPVLGSGFLIWDDNVNLIENPSLWQSTGKALQWMFADLESVQRYKPLNWFAWHLLGQSFGLKAEAFHALNLVLHAGNAVLLYRVIKNFLPKPVAQIPSATNPTSVAALAGTLWWALHPLRVEPVAWISGAGYPLSTCFSLLAVLAFQHHLRDTESSHRWWAVLFFGLSLLSYPAAAALPGLLLALAWLHTHSVRTPTRQEIKQLGRLLLPHVGLATLVLGATLAVGLTTTSVVWDRAASWDMLGFGPRVMQAFAVWEWYLGKTLLPLQLAPVYPDFWNFSPLGFRAVASVIVIVLISAVAWRRRRNFPEIPVLWAAFLLLAVPLLGLTEHPFSPSDRYTYVPDLALALLLASLLQRSFSARRGRIAILTATLIVITAYTAATFVQLQVWRSPVAFFTRAIASVGARPAAANLHWRLGLHYLSAQQNALAAAEFEAVLRLTPGDPDAMRNLRILHALLQSPADPIQPETKQDASR